MAPAGKGGYNAKQQSKGAQQAKLLKHSERKPRMFNIDAGGVQSRRVIDRIPEGQRRERRRRLHATPLHRSHAHPTTMSNLNDMKSPAAAGTVREASQTERAIMGLREAVLRGHFAPSERLSEVEVADHLGVSRTPIRAAMQRLAEEGLLEAVQPSGYVVRAFSEQDIADAIEVRGTIEALAARMAAERGVSRLILQQMRDCANRMEALFEHTVSDQERLEQYALWNERFHALILEAAGSGVVQRTLTRVAALPFASPSAFVSAQARLPGSVAIMRMAMMQHYDIVDAIEGRASARVEALVKEHSRIAHKHLELALRHRDVLDSMVGAPLIQRG